MLRCGLDPGYVLDKIEMYEIDALMENLWMKNKDSWEQARMQAYFTAQVNSTKKLDMMELIKFPWEDMDTESVESTKEEREAVFREMKEWEKIINKKEIDNGQ